jgi:hypothetical protein
MRRKRRAGNPSTSGGQTRGLAWMDEIARTVGKKLSELSRSDRCSTANPMHRATETILERIDTEGFKTKPSPT